MRLLRTDNPGIIHFQRPGKAFIVFHHAAVVIPLGKGKVHCIVRGVAHASQPGGKAMTDTSRIFNILKFDQRYSFVFNNLCGTIIIGFYYLQNDPNLTILYIQMHF